MKNQTLELLEGVPEYLKQRSSMVWLKEGQVLIWEGDRTEHVYILLAGKLRVVRAMKADIEYTLGYMTPGRYVCDMELLSDHMVNAATLVAAEECLLLKFGHKDFSTCLDNDIPFLRQVVKRLVSSLTDNVYDSSKLAASNRTEKLVVYLLDYYAKRASDEKSCIPVDVTRENLAFELNVSVKTINRAVKELKDNGLLTIKRRKLFLDQDQVAQLHKYLKFHKM